MTVESKEKNRKHLVTRSLPNGCCISSPLPGKAMAAAAGAGHWMIASVAVNVLLLLILVCEKRGHTNLCDGIPGKAMCTTKASPKEVIEERSHPCSHHGYLLRHEYSNGEVCRCHTCFQGESCAERDMNCIINLDHGDPTMFETFWERNGGSATTIILGWHRMSYFAESESICWFLEQKLSREIRALHHLVGNAVTQGYHIVVGTGSTQLFQAALYSLSPAQKSKPTSVVSAAPFYSSYATVTDYLKSEIYRWAGDAVAFNHRTDVDDYIELVTSPNNPDGSLRQAVVDGNGAVVYDLAYYWPHYTPISYAAEHDIMLFTVSKSTGHAGTRIGWALVKDESIARKMTKFIELNTIGVSQDAQLRTAQILGSVVNAYAHREDTQFHLFHHGYATMESRWSKLRLTLSGSDRFSVPDFQPAYCSFFGGVRNSHPAFAWLRCNHEEDCQEFLKQNGIIVRGGQHFGADPKFVRMSMLDRDDVFELLIDRLAGLQSQTVAVE